MMLKEELGKIPAGTTGRYRLIDVLRLHFAWSTDRPEKDRIGIDGHSEWATKQAEITIDRIVKAVAGEPRE